MVDGSISMVDLSLSMLRDSVEDVTRCEAVEKAIAATD
jgi:hypothetical protein